MRLSIAARPGLSILLPLTSFAVVVGGLGRIRRGWPTSLDDPSSPVFGVTLGLIGTLLCLAFFRTNWLSCVLAASLSLALFALPLAAVWKTGRTDGTRIGGLLPYSDADGYYHCARVLVEGGTFRSSAYPVLCSQRPLFTTMFSGLLGVTRQNLRVSLAILVLMVAACLLLAARELRASLGPVAATVFLLIAFLFYRPFAGAALTENLGLSLGAVGFTGLWRGSRTGEFKIFLMGMLLFSLGLIARAGAFFALPAVALWGAHRFRESSLVSWRRLAFLCGVVALGFAINGSLVRGLGVKGAAFSNFPYCLYGLVFGGNYKLALAQHPDLAPLGEIEASSRIFDIALEGIRTEPLRLAKGFFRAWREFIGTPYLFRYVPSGGLNLGLRLLTLAGLIFCLVQRRDPVASLLLVIALGTFLSVPFAAPWDVDMRAYAATLPFLAALPAWAVGGLFRGAAASPATGLSVYACGLLTLMFALPAVAWRFASQRGFETPSNSACSDPVYLHPPLGSYVHVVRSDTLETRYPSEIRQNEFRRGLRRFKDEFPGLGEELGGLRAPVLLWSALGLQPFKNYYVLAPSGLIDERSWRAPFWRVCLKSARDPQSDAYGLRYATSIEPIEASGASPAGRNRVAPERRAEAEARGNPAVIARARSAGSE